ncbi:MULTISPECIES: hypothetical protein [unclassified Rhodococcus (in: high G+C Gram-positive bacteria)]|uniref:hypothetical protein n=1 Tax=unclassified Rhodococcus (in: high G+C Gram-positive bacteria) TaxID=192944 RepID=UPI000ADC8B8E|nr:MULTISPECIES: hypothetical protein [unclassified Rhodococcus (in: high G+C Gram-positive bacteria)]
MPDRFEDDNTRVTALSLAVSLSIAETPTDSVQYASTTNRTILRASKFEDYLRNGKL